MRYAKGLMQARTRHSGGGLGILHTFRSRAPPTDNDYSCKGEDAKPGQQPGGAVEVGVKSAKAVGTHKQGDRGHDS